MTKGDGRRETEEAREAEELCRLEGSGSSEEGPSRQRKNPGQIVLGVVHANVGQKLLNRNIFSNFT